MDRGLLRHIQEHLLRPMATRLANTVARAVVQLVDDSTKLQLLQVGALADETIDGAEHHQSYGFSSVPLDGAEAVVVFPNGDRSHALVVSVSDRRYRPSGGVAGEVVVYTDEGDEIRLGRGQMMTLKAGVALKLGSASAAQAAIKGTQRNTAEQVFLTALGVWIAAIGTATGASGPTTTMQTALTTFAAAATAALSTKVKLE